MFTFVWMLATLLKTYTEIIRHLESRAKIFYLSLVGAIIQIESFELVKEIVFNMLIMANFPFIGTKLNDEESPASNSREKLTHDVEFMETKVESEEVEAGINMCGSQNSDNETDISVEWFNILLLKVQTILQNHSDSTGVENAFFVNGEKMNNWLRDLMKRTSKSRYLREKNLERSW